MTRMYANRLMTMLFALLLMSCNHDEAKAQNANEETMKQKLYLTIDGQTLPATLVSNKATEALVAALAESPITYQADDYGGFEKVGDLGRSLPTNNTQITTQAGDVILYSGNQIVLFYGSNSWSYTRLGRIEFDSLEQLKEFLKAGKGKVSVTLSVNSTSGIRPEKAEDKPSDDGVSLNGIRTNKPGKGVYISNGKKFIK